MMEGVTSLWMAWTEFIVAIRKIQSTPPAEWRVDFMTDIVFSTDDTSRMSLPRHTMSVLVKSLRKLRHSPVCPRPSTIMDFVSSHAMTTTCTSPTHAPIQTEVVDVRGSSTVSLGGDGEDLDFDEELASLASRLATGSGSLDITLQTAESPFMLSAEKRMEQYVYELKIYRYVSVVHYSPKRNIVNLFIGNKT